MERDTIKEFFEKKAEEERKNSLLPGLERRASVDTKPQLEEKRPASKFRQNAIIWLGALAAAALLIYGGKMIFDRYELVTQSRPADIVAEVGMVVDLPQGETPTVATITTMDNLKGQAFFKDAMLGDKVIVYNTAKKAVLYRPSTKKVIAVAPLSQ